MTIHHNDNEEYHYDDSNDIDCFMYFDSKKIDKYSDLDNIYHPDYHEGLHKIIYNKPALKIKYTYNYKFDPLSFEKGHFDLKADNGENFTKRELMYKINNNVYQFYFDKDVVLEALIFIETQSDGIDLYELGIGS